MAKFDFFRQASKDTAKSTVFGGFISILCLLTIVYLLLWEVGTYASSTVEVSTVIQSAFADSEYDILAINMTIYEVPCTLISVEFTNDLNPGVEEELDVDKLARTRLFPNGTFVKGDDIYTATKGWKNQTLIENYLHENLVPYESCNLFGIVQLQRAPGNIHFAMHTRKNHMEAAKTVSWVKPYLSNHEVHSLQFATSLKQILSNEDGSVESSFDQDSNTFDRIKDYDTGIYRSLDGAQQVLYYANIVPHQFIDPRSGYELNTYSYSINSNSKQVRPDESIIQFYYEFSPITMVVKKKNAESIGRFVVNICGSIGGVFVIFGILNRLVTYLVSSMLNK